MERSPEALPIEEKQLAAYSDQARALVMNVKYVPKQMGTGGSEKDSSGGPSWRTSPSLSAASEQQLSLMKLAAGFSQSSPLLPENLNHVMNAIFHGIRIGAHLSKLYTDSSGLATLIERNQRGRMQPAEIAEFRDKSATAAAISIFATAYHIVWDVSHIDAGESKLEVEGIPEVSLVSPVEAMNCMLYYYGAQLARPQFVQNPIDFVRVTQAYFKAVVDAIKTRADSLKYTEPFTSRVYKLEKTEFAVNGFTADIGASLVSVEFNRVEIGEIVGNRAAKRQAVLLAQRLMCYDFDSKRNPMLKLGGLPKIRMGDGPPGTGKSMLIAAVATLLGDYCKALKYPFLFRPLPDNIVSTFQGGTAEKGVEWFVGFNDPSRIIYGTIDDGEVVLEDRTRQNVSAGVREFIGVFLRRTEGAYAVNHGNFTIDIYTNLPDQLDKAVLSRIVSRFLIAGAETAHDFVDQDYLWWKKYRDLDPKFVDMDDDPTYEFLLEQKMLKTLSETAVRYSEPQDERLRRIFKQVRDNRNPRQHAFFGELFAAVRAEFPFFTSRDLRNIEQAVDGRILDFELEDRWLEHPEEFYFLGYDQKMNILREKMRGNMKGLSFAEVRLQETIMYFDQMVRMAEVTRKRTIDEGVDRMVMNLEVDHRLGELRSSGRLSHLIKSN